MARKNVSCPACNATWEFKPAELPRMHRCDCGEYWAPNLVIHKNDPQNAVLENERYYEIGTSYKTIYEIQQRKKQMKDNPQGGGFLTRHHNIPIIDNMLIGFVKYGIIGVIVLFLWLASSQNRISTNDANLPSVTETQRNAKGVEAYFEDKYPDVPRSQRQGAAQRIAEEWDKAKSGP